MRASQKEKWWIVIINLGGITGPICCTREPSQFDDGDKCWDRSGNWDCSMKEGLTIEPQISKFETRDKEKAKLFALGAKTLAAHLTEYLKT